MTTTEFIKAATDHDGCSTGQYHCAMFIKSCINYATRANMKEVLYYADLNIIKEILDMTDADTLEEAVRELNPKLLEVT